MAQRLWSIRDQEPARQHFDDRSDAFAALVMRVAAMTHPRIAMPLAVLVENASSDLRVVAAFAERGDLRSLLQQARQADSNNSDGEEDGDQWSTLTWEDDKGVIALDVAEALAYLHGEQPNKVVTVLRDLNTSHVLVDGDGHARINVASLSRTQPAVINDVASSTSHQAELSGVRTEEIKEASPFPHWLVPEVLRGGMATEASDVYSFDVLLCELNTGRVPYHGQGWRELKAGVVSGELCPRLTASCPRRIEELAIECMLGEPLCRPRASQVLYRLRDIIKSDL